MGLSVPVCRYEHEMNTTRTTVASALGTLSLTNGTWYEAKVVIDDDPCDSALQRLGWDGHLARQQGGRGPIDRRDAYPPMPYA